MAAPIPNTSFSFPNGGLGIQPASPDNIVAVVGASSAGTAATPTSIGGRVSNVVDQFGYGPGPSLAAALIRSGATVIFVKAASTNQAAGTVTEGPGVGTSNMTVTGTGLDGFYVVVTITRGGTAVTDLTIAFTVSLDGGRTTSKEITLPANGIYTGLVATTGHTLTFSAGTLIAGTTYSFTTPPPVVAAADVVTALAALKTSTHSFALVHVAAPFDADDVSTITAEIASIVARKKFCRAIFESLDEDSETEAEWMATLSDDFADFSSDIVTVGAGYIGILDAITGTRYGWRSIAWLGTIRAVQVALQRDLAAVADGPLTPWLSEGQGAPAVMDGVPATGKFIHDEELVPGLNAQRFMTIRSLVGEIGYFVTNPNVMSGPTSDYDLLQFGRVADAVARTTNTFFTQQLSNDVNLNPTTGRILEVDAKSLEAGNDTACARYKAAKNVSTLQTQVSRDDNIIVDRELTVDVKMVPKGYLKEITISIGFVPSL
jgi:hypothetical protein